MSVVQRLLASVWVGSLALACGAVREPAEPLPGRPEALRLARRLAQTERKLAEALAHGGLEARGAAASSPEAATDPFVRLPRAADGAIDFRAGQRAAPLARIRTLGAGAAPLELVDGVALYRAAVAGSDALWLLRGNALEQLLVVREAAPRVAFAWELCHAAELGRQRSSPELGLVWSDEQGTDRLRVPPAFVIDSRGRRRELAVHYSADRGTCGRVDFTLDARGLVPPLLVDPALEAVVWTDRTDPENKPTGRYGHGLAYDPVRAKTVLFGGTVNAPPPFLGDTWEWDGAAWSEVTPGTGPEGRLYHDLAYSSVHGGVVMIGGVTTFEFASAKHDAWVWDGTWTELVPGGDELPSVFGHSLAFDSAREVVVLYGGYSEADDGHVWELDGAKWSDRGATAISPGSVDMFSMAYVTADRATLVFGGSAPAGWSDDPFNPRSDAAYLWNGKGWKSIDTERPSPRSGMAGAYDSKRGRVVLFGGTDGERYDDQTWEYADGRFELREPLRAPPARESAKLAYDAARDRVVLFGGFGDTDGDDTWTYAHFGNRCRDESDCDGEACVDGVCCEDKLCGTCQACSEETGRCEPVVSAEDADSGCTGALSCSATGACRASSGERCDDDEQCASGHCADGVCCERACDGACEACATAGHEGECRFVEGEAAHGACPGHGTCASLCDGEHPDCGPVPEGLDCGTSCEEAVLTLKACDAKGVCRSQAPTECAEHLRCADPKSCLTRCAGDDDCGAGFACQSGACAPPSARCVDDVTAEGPGGREDCGAYVCDAGRCRTSCRRASDCASGRVCNDAGRCLAPEAAAGGEPRDEGCNCRATRAEGRGRWAPLALLALALLRRRSRA